MPPLIVRCCTGAALVIGLLIVSASIVRAVEPAGVEKLRLNQLQFIGSHNSYHVRPPQQTLNLAKGVNRDAQEWDYSHAPLDVQLDRGVRSFELDMHYKDGEFEVFHVPFLDEGSTCRKLIDGLRTVRAWSEKNPGHLPVSFLCEFKSEGIRLDKRIKEVDPAGFDRLDVLIRSVFPAESLLTPDDVRGAADSLREAIQKQGWPTVAKCRGRVFFILHDVGKYRDIYSHERPSQRGRVMFVRSDPQRDDSAMMVLDNPQAREIPDRVREGIFVRTRADAGLKVRDNRRDDALASGAQIISSDFPPGEAHAENDYVVEFKNAAPARVNPVNGPETLRGQLVPK